MKKLLKLCLVPLIAVGIMGALSLSETADKALKTGIMAEVSAEEITGKCGDNLTYTISEDGTLTITGTGDMYNYTNPNKAPWYDYRTSLKNLNINSGITSIGSYAFSGYSQFTGRLMIPDSVTSIGNYAFYYCSGFTGRLTIPNSVTSIGDYAFYNCSGFTGNLTIPNSVTSIGNYAFRDCSGFTGRLTIPNSVTSIGDYAFYNCSGFTGNLTIGNSVKSIGGSAFSNCSGFTGNLTIPDSVKYIGGSAFKNCSGFTGNLTILNSVTYIGNYAFYNCIGFTGNLTIPNSVTSIGSYAFAYCKGFTGNLTIPDSVTSIGSYAFKNCRGFTGKLTIGNSVTSIGEYAFDECNGFTGNLTIPDSVTSIGNFAFYDCSGFDTLSVLSYDVSIDGKAFPYSINKVECYRNSTTDKYYSNSTSVTITYLSHTVTGKCGDNLNYEIAYDEGAGGYYLRITGTGDMYNYSGKNAPWADHDIEAVYFPSDITSIGDYAFYLCDSLTAVYDEYTQSYNRIPFNVTSIGDSAFDSAGLKGSLIIPDSVTEIKPYAFIDCTALDDITVLNKNTTIGDSALENISKVRCFKSSTADSYSYTSGTAKVYIQEQGTINVCIPKPNDGKWIHKVNISIYRGDYPISYELTECYEDNGYYVFPVFIYADSYVGISQSLNGAASYFYNYTDGEVDDMMYYSYIDADEDDGSAADPSQLYIKNIDLGYIDFELKEVE